MRSVSSVSRRKKNSHIKKRIRTKEYRNSVKFLQIKSSTHSHFLSGNNIKADNNKNSAFL